MVSCGVMVTPVVSSTVPVTSSGMVPQVVSSLVVWDPHVVSGGVTVTVRVRPAVAAAVMPMLARTARMRLVMARSLSVVVV